MLLHHTINEHEWLTGSCEHEALTGPPTDGDGRQLEYFSQNEPAFRALQKIVMDVRWLKSMTFYTKFRYSIHVMYSQMLCYYCIC